MQASGRLRKVRKCRAAVCTGFLDKAKGLA